MDDREWRIHVDYQLEKILEFQRWQKRVWWAMAGAIGLVLLPRFINFLITGLAVAQP